MPHLAIVIPAYNEAGRIGPYLAEIRGHLDAAYPGGYEVIVADDGSTDGTADLVRRAAAGWRPLRLVRLGTNAGKGAAVRAGVAAATAGRVLFADADGATPIAEEWKLSLALARGAAVAVGSRYLPGPGVTRTRQPRRAVVGTGFRLAARGLVGVRVTDTQCGFKMFTADAARALFGAGRETGYLFDLELLALAERFGLPVAEVAINWAEKPGSKVRFVRDGLRMFTGLWRLRRQLRTAPAAPAELPGAARRAA
ncbi:MAG TPA: dolichyl-phosphate beta-glucosyltransferase [Urbifossiella sp.]|nr:dolichyl-phosphate beta-glucosyltransferase [Urbifossiella sp.]